MMDFPYFSLKLFSPRMSMFHGSTVLNLKKSGGEEDNKLFLG